MDCKSKKLEEHKDSMKITVNFFNYRNLKPITLSDLDEQKLVVH